jgi:hypothetical protein
VLPFEADVVDVDPGEGDDEPEALRAFPFLPAPEGDGEEKAGECEEEEADVEVEEGFLAGGGGRLAWTMPEARDAMVPPADAEPPSCLMKVLRRAAVEADRGG